MSSNLCHRHMVTFQAHEQERQLKAWKLKLVLSPTKHQERGPLHIISLPVCLDLALKIESQGWNKGQTLQTSSRRPSAFLPGFEQWNHVPHGAVTGSALTIACHTEKPLAFCRWGCWSPNDLVSTCAQQAPLPIALAALSLGFWVTLPCSVSCLRSHLHSPTVGELFQLWPMVKSDVSCIFWLLLTFFKICIFRPQTGPLQNTEPNHFSSFKLFRFRMTHSKYKSN